ncbi:D-alanine--D-alanine ligase [Sediminibacillus dalangtanensis]|uniref:D-alanine--D-alanine ligase n=1 Tax=Sediminibacillus dalangtanensis TaxID=2729421 RepID=A0ABX7VS43_9BACI|nr:D-alanine--D-alanine ligase [Sediminibacillus dalangtanensis]QTM99756.1 D-alanine--D-alanine ligase [Sediminibacillus dalangtanensis]
MKKKTRVGLIFGGKSAEHEVSLQSAKNIVDAIDKEKYEVTLIGIDKEGKWHLNNQSHFLMNEENPKLIEMNKSNQHIAIIPGEDKQQMMNLKETVKLEQLDVIFPILHGTLGEDGSIQGMMRLANLPYVGSNVLGSAVCMDKDITKKLLQQAGIEVAKSVTLKKHQKETVSFADVKEQLGLPVFIKPASQGSSVGVSKVNDEAAFRKAIEMAFLYDHKVLIEESVEGREVECAVLGNEEPKASLPGEILPQGDFYSYETKYIDENGAVLEIPAQLSDEEIRNIQDTAIQAFRVLECEGLARVDFFLKQDGSLVLNEVNTLPGFTKISMYPQLWGVSGLSYPDLIDQLIQLAITRHERDKSLKNTVE